MFKNSILALALLAVAFSSLHAANPGPTPTPSPSPSCTPSGGGGTSFWVPPPASKDPAPAASGSVVSDESAKPKKASEDPAHSVAKTAVPNGFARHAAPLSEGGSVSSVQFTFPGGRVTYTVNQVAQTGSFEWKTYSSNIDDTTCRRPTLSAIKKDQPPAIFIGDGGTTTNTARVRQVLTDQYLIDVQDSPSVVQGGVEVIQDSSSAGVQGYVVKVYPRSQVGALSGSFYPFSGNPLRTVTYTRVDTNTVNIYSIEIKNGTPKQITWHWNVNANTWVMEQWSGDYLGNSGAATLWQRTTLLRTNGAAGYSQTRNIETLSPNGELKLTYSAWEQFDNSTDQPKMLKQIRGGPSDSTWTYISSTDSQINGLVETLRRADGYWENYSYTEGTGGFLTTRMVSGWNNSAPGDESSSRVVTTVLGSQSHGPSSRVETIGGVVVASDTATSTTSGGITTETRTVKASPSDLVTVTKYYEGSDPAKADKPLSIVNPDGSVVLYTYSKNSAGNVTTTEQRGAGSTSAVTDGTKKVTVNDPDGNLIEETWTDIRSGLEIYRKTADLSSKDDSGVPQKYYYFNNTNDFEMSSGGCCNSVTSRSQRDGQATNYLYDGLDRRTHAISGYPGQPTEDLETIYDGLTTTVTRTVGASSVLVSETTLDLAGNIVSQKAPDANGDGVPEVTTFATDVRSGGGQKTTQTNPDGSTRITETYNDGGVKKIYGTAVPDTAYEYGTWAGGKFTKTIRLSATGGTDEWVKTYFDGSGRTVKVENPTSSGGTASTNYTCDGAGRVIKSIDPDGVTTLYSYDPNGDQASTAIDMDGNGQIDRGGTDRITETTNSVVSDSSLGVCNKTVTQVYAQDSSATPTVISTQLVSVNGLGSRTVSLNGTTSAVQTFPDSGAWTVTTTNPDGTQQVDQYTNGRISQRTVKDTAGGQISQTTLGYDLLGRNTSSTDARTGTTTLAYYDNGNLRSLVSPHDNDTTVYIRDVMGRITDIQFPDGSSQHGSYSLAGKLEWITGSQAYPQNYSYDEQGRMTELHTFQDGASGAPQVTKWHYDPATGLLQWKEYANGKGPSYSYTDGGRLQTRTWARGVVATYGYNAAGDLTSITYSDNTPAVGIAYNRFGQKLLASNTVSATAYGYDSALRPTTETVTGTVSRILRRDYDALGRPDGIAVLSGTNVEHQVGYGYDAAGRLATVTRGSGMETFTYGYVPNSAGLIASLTGPLTVTNIWESNRDELEARENKCGKLVVSRYDYVVNALGQLVSVQQRGSAFGGNFFNLYGYDGMGQLTSAQRYAGGTLDAPQNPVAGQQFGFTFDTIGNRLTATDGTVNTIYSPNALNQYSTIQIGASTASPVYDDDGNLINDGTLISQWDGENRLVNVTKPDGTKVASAYDAQSRRVRKTVTSGGATVSDTGFVYDGWNQVAEYILTATVDPTLSVANTWGLDLSGSLQGAEGVGGLLARTNGGVTYVYTYDGNWNVSEMFDATDIAAHYEYGPFGEFVKVFGAVATQNPFRFSTKYMDDETGLLYYGYRYYNPVDGRWVNRDPMEERGGVNLYTFVCNAPSVKIDVLGLVDVDKDLVEPTSVSPFILPWLFDGGVSSTSFGGGVKCKCDNGCKVKCNVKLTARIVLSPKQAKLRGVNLEGIYGHEQRHIQSRSYLIDLTVVKGIEQESGQGAGSCKDEAKRIQKQYNDSFQSIIRNGSDHADDPNSPSTPFSPENKTPSPPIPGSSFLIN